MQYRRLYSALYIVVALWIIMKTSRCSASFLYVRHCVASRRFRPFRLCVHRPSRNMLRQPRISLKHDVRVFSSGSPQDFSDRKQLRVDALHKELNNLNIDATALQDADSQVLQNPTDGYDGRYGRSAIRTYRSFIESKKINETLDVSVLAARIARQIEFLIKRHKSHEAEWIRHTDTERQQSQRFPLILLLDNVRSAFNVGSLFCTADACGCCEVITAGITPHPGGSGADKLARSALGADRFVASRHFDTTWKAIDTLRRDLPHYKLVGLETTKRSSLHTDMRYCQDGVVLILGNEVTGVDTEILALLDGIVEIPMFGEKNSLNVAACAPVVLYEILRQWKILERK